MPRNQEYSPSAGATDAFIPGIEGMRALAVLAVLLYHLAPALVPAGYLGVDLFYVISGFVITRNALQDLQARRFSLKYFYYRRYRRLAPALAVTILLTVAAGYLVMPPAELASTAKAGVYGLFSLANFHFWWDAGYFEAAAHSKPLLHTWSLSVEEQFYLLWPLALLLLYPTRYRRLLAPGLFLLSLGLAFYYREKIPDALFYLLPFRIHQLMAGAVLAIFSLQLRGRPGSLAALAGTAGFLWACLAMSGQTPPFTTALTLSATGAIMVAASQSAVAERWLGLAPMQWLGRRSYALYLVHWPLIVLFSYHRDFDLSDGERVGLAIASIAAAAALHTLVEKPLRLGGSSARWLQSAANPIAAGILLAAVFLSSNFWGFAGFPERADPRIREMVEKLPGEMALRKTAIRYGTCNLHRHHSFEDYDAAACGSPQPGRRNVLVIGDSVGADTYMMLSLAYPGIAFSQATAAGCTALIELEDVVESLYPACRRLNELRFRELAMKDFDLVVLASVWKPERIEPLRETLAFLHASGKNVLMTGPRMAFFASVPTLASQQISLDSANNRLAQLANREEALLADMRAKITATPIIDMAAIQCRDGCRGIQDGRLLYIDAFHFTRFGARAFGRTFRETVDLPALMRNGVKKR